MTHAKESSRGVVARLRELLSMAAQGTWTVIHGNEVNTPKGVVAHCEDTNHISECEASALLIATLHNNASDLLRVVEAVAREPAWVTTQSGKVYCWACSYPRRGGPDSIEPQVHADDCEYALARKLTGGAL